MTEALPQCEIAVQLALESESTDTPCRSWALHDGIQRFAHHAQRHLCTEHAFSTYHTHFQHRLAVQDGDKGNKGLPWEVNMTNQLGPVAQHVCHFQLHGFTEFQQTHT